MHHLHEHENVENGEKTIENIRNCINLKFKMLKYKINIDEGVEKR
jgi:hypothetical protein